MIDSVEELLTRGVANIIPGKNELSELLKSGRKLNTFLGIDPTAPKIHLGHAVPLRKLQILAEMGHNVTLLIGDFTTLVGDTSDKESERPILTPDEIRENFQTYKKQAEKILDFSKIKIKYNSEWLEKLTFAEIIKLQQRFTLNDFISRELIKKRLNSGKSVRFDELSYPLMQGYDSYIMDTDIQFGGTDQTFNMQAGRTLQKALRNKESFIITNIFLDGTDGRKMSKSWGNAIWLDDKPNEIYAKVMAINDELIIQYYTLATNVPLAEIRNIEENLKKSNNPMKVKKDLAFKVVEELYSKTDAEAGKINFENTVQDRAIPEDIPVHTVDTAGTIAEVLAETGLTLSKSDAKRLIEQGGVEVDGEKITDGNIPFKNLVIKEETLIQIGKRRFIKVRLK